MLFCQAECLLSCSQACLSRICCVLYFVFCSLASCDFFSCFMCNQESFCTLASCDMFVFSCTLASQKFASIGSQLILMSCILYIFLICINWLSIDSHLLYSSLSVFVFNLSLFLNNQSNSLHHLNPLLTRPTHITKSSPQSNQSIFFLTKPNHIPSP